MRGNVIGGFIILCIVSVATCAGQSLRPKSADRHFFKGNYAAVVQYYNSEAEKSNAPTDILRKAAICCKETGDAEKAEKWYTKLTNRMDVVPADLQNYFQVLVQNGNYTKASMIAERYVKFGGKDDVLRFYYNNPQFWKDKKKVAADHTLQKLPFNTSNKEIAPEYFGGYIYYTLSDDPAAQRGKHKIKLDELYNRYPMQLSSVRVEQNGTYGNIQPIKMKDGELAKDAIVSYGKNFTLLTMMQRERSSWLQYAIRGADGYWGSYIDFPYNSTEYSVGRAAISPNEQRLVFSSDMPGGYGGMDLWICERNGNSWHKPVNLGRNVNTAKSEIFPEFGPDGKLYFASDGHPGYGRYDIYAGTFITHDEVQVKNMGNIINSNYDEAGIATTDKKNTWFFSSNIGGSFDLYYLNMGESPGTSDFLVTTESRYEESEEMPEFLTKAKEEEKMPVPKPKTEITPEPVMKNKAELSGALSEGTTEEIIDITPGKLTREEKYAEIEKTEKEIVDDDDGSYVALDVSGIAEKTPVKNPVIQPKTEPVKKEKPVKETSSLTDYKEFYAVQIAAFRNKNVDIGSIIKPQIKSRIKEFYVVEAGGWTRVRFGKYPDKASAVNAAKSMGIATPYVVMMKGAEIKTVWKP